MSRLFISNLKCNINLWLSCFCSYSAPFYVILNRIVVQLRTVTLEGNISLFIAVHVWTYAILSKECNLMLKGLVFVTFLYSSPCLGMHHRWRSQIASNLLSGVTTCNMSSVKDVLYKTAYFIIWCFYRFSVNSAESAESQFNCQARIAFFSSPGRLEGLPSFVL